MRLPPSTARARLLEEDAFNRRSTVTQPSQQFPILSTRARKWLVRPWVPQGRGEVLAGFICLDALNRRTAVDRSKTPFALTPVLSLSKGIEGRPDACPEHDEGYRRLYRDSNRSLRERQRHVCVHLDLNSSPRLRRRDLSISREAHQRSFWQQWNERGGPWQGYLVARPFSIAYAVIPAVLCNPSFCIAVDLCFSTVLGLSDSCSAISRFR
jgi:hypothetical protein